MIIDLVRASNDKADIGFVSDGRRLNVLITRQQQAVIIVGDQNCTQVVEVGSEEKTRKLIMDRFATSLVQTGK